MDSQDQADNLGESSLPIREVHLISPNQITSRILSPYKVVRDKLHTNN